MNSLKTRKQLAFRTNVRSRHPTHSPLRDLLPRLTFRSILRLGSLTEINDGRQRVEINTVEAIKNSMNKLRMKTKFSEAGVKTAKWSDGSKEPELDINNLEFPIVAKHIFGSRNRGNTLLKNLDELMAWNTPDKDLSNYIFEQFYNYNREYRLHVTKDGCFYTNRKMIRQDTPQDKRWFRNDSNSNWIKEDNELFDKPVNWDAVVEESVKALKAVGLDIGAVDLRIQSSRNRDGELRDNPDFIIVEINSAPSFGEITLQKYLEVLPKLIQDKYAGTVS